MAPLCHLHQGIIPCAHTEVPAGCHQAWGTVTFPSPRWLRGFAPSPCFTMGTGTGCCQGAWKGVSLLKDWATSPSPAPRMPETEQAETTPLRMVTLADHCSQLGGGQ